MVGGTEEVVVDTGFVVGLLADAPPHPAAAATAQMIIEREMVSFASFMLSDTKASGGCERRTVQGVVIGDRLDPF